MVTVKGATAWGNGLTWSLNSNGCLPIKFTFSPGKLSGLGGTFNGPTERYGGKIFSFIDKVLGNWGWLIDGFGVITTVPGSFDEKLLYGVNGLGVDWIGIGGMYSLNWTGALEGDEFDGKKLLKPPEKGGGARVVVIREFTFDGAVMYEYRLTGDSVEDWKYSGAGVCCDTTEYGVFILGL